MMKQTFIAYFLFASVLLVSTYNNVEKEKIRKLADELLRNDEEADETAGDDDIFDEETMEKLADGIASNGIDGDDNEEASDEIFDDEYIDIKVDYDLNEVQKRKIDPLFFGKKRRFSRRKRSWFARRRRCGASISRRRSANCYTMSNGCGGMGSTFPVPYKEPFREACNKHDICYYCGQVQGWTRKHCDRSMHNDFRTICSCKYKSWKAVGKIPCYTTAKTMHLAVRLFGEKYFQKQSPAWCMNQCVVGKGSPKLQLK